MHRRTIWTLRSKSDNLQGYLQNFLTRRGVERLPTEQQGMLVNLAPGHVIPQAREADPAGQDIEVARQHGLPLNLIEEDCRLLLRMVLLDYLNGVLRTPEVGGRWRADENDLVRLAQALMHERRLDPRRSIDDHGLVLAAVDGRFERRRFRGFDPARGGTLRVAINQTHPATGVRQCAAEEKCDRGFTRASLAIAECDNH